MQKKNIKQEAVAIDRISNEMLERVKNQMLGEIVADGKEQIAIENKVNFDAAAEEVSEQILDMVVQEQVNLQSQLKMEDIRFEQVTSSEASKSIIDDMSNNIIRNQVNLIVFELKMADKLEKGLVSHNQNINEVWNTLINDLIKSEV